MLIIQMQPINYNDPIELIEIFRYDAAEERSQLGRPEYDDPLLNDLVEGENGKEKELKEFCKKHWVTWEDVKSISEYPFPDDWKKFPGEKFFIDLKDGKYILIQGSATAFAQAWSDFRNKYRMYP